MKLYLLVHANAELTTEGPYKSKNLRLVEAKKIWSDLNPSVGDNIFMLDIDAKGCPLTHCFLDGDLEE